MKKLLSLALALVLCLGLIPTTALAAESDFVIENGVLTQYTGPGGDVVIPDGVTEIDWFAFSECKSLTSVTIPNSVTAIGNGAFFGCTGLTSVVISNSVTEISLFAFEGCTSLTSVTIPDSVTAICTEAFCGCTSLASVTIPNSVTEISLSAFDGCTSLTNITVAEDSQSYASQDGVLFNKTKTKLVYYPEGKTGAYTIPNSVTEIGGGAFSGRTDLTDVVIPNSVTKIGNGAFRDCTSLTSVTIPDSVTEIGECAFWSCTGLTSVTIPDSVTEIGEHAFWSCTGLTSVTIPDSVTKIGESAFSGCIGLTSVTIPGSVAKIGDGAFDYCTGLTSVTIPDSVTEIGDVAFRYCSGLTSVVIPDSVTKIGTSAFFDCTGLTDVYYGGTQEQWKAIEIKFGNNTLKSATIHCADTTMAPTTMAYATPQTVNLDGSPVEFQCYALKDQNGNLTNYIKLRDLAYLLNGTAAQFEVGWYNNTVYMEPHQTYTPNGSELSTPYSGDRLCHAATSETAVFFRAVDIAAFTIQDDNGGGYTYYQLRDLGQALGFNVGWSADKGVFIETDKPYDPAN